MANSDDDFQQSAPTIIMKSKTRIKTSAKRPPENPTTDVVKLIYIFIVT